MATGTMLWQQQLEQGRRRLDDRFLAGADIVPLLRARARLVDGLLCRAWQSETGLRNASLFAVGGFGRRELFPYSDVDILVLCEPGQVPHKSIEGFLSCLWDVGLRPSHSVRCLAECVSEAKKELSVLTAMLEARQLCGVPHWGHELGKVLAPGMIWSVQEFFRARIREQTARRAKFARVMHNLEPSIKESCGGLRDLHMLYWIALRCFAEGGLSGLYRNGLIDSREKRSLQDAQNLLSRMRYALHLVTERTEERLLFEYQRSVATLLGGDGSQAAVEAMMKSYCCAAGVVDLHNEIVLCDFEQRITPSRRPRMRALNERFAVRDSYLELRSQQQLRQQPGILVEAFALLAKRPRLRGFAAATMRQIRDFAAKHGAILRDDQLARSWLLKLLKAKGAGESLRRMHRYGVLDALIPAFAQVRGLTQFDLSHVHSVDVHTTLVLGHLDDFFARREDDYPEYHGLSHNITRPEVLYLAALFHDLGKGRGGNHSLLGAVEVEQYCRHLQLDETAVRLAGWLVRNHLLMSRTAQREDIDDPEVCDHFVTKVEDVEHLDCLYLLTAADIRGTNPDLWNQWKHHLLSTLYRRALRRLRHSQDTLLGQRLQERQQQALALLSAGHAKAAPTLWRDWHQDTFRRYQPEEIALQTRHILRSPRQRLQMLLQPRTSRSCTEVFLYMPARDDLFASVTRVLDQLNLNVVDARIIQRAPGLNTIDSYAMLEQDGRCVRSRVRIEEIRTTLHKALRRQHVGKLSLLPPIRTLPHKLRHFSVPTEVGFTTDKDKDEIIMDVTALDQPGLLCRIATILHNAGVVLLGARITTFGERAEDIFYLQGDLAAAQCEQLRQEIIATTNSARIEDVKVAS